MRIVIFIMAIFLISCIEKKQTSLDTIQTWCKLDSWPTGIVSDSLEIKGSSFTREFVYTITIKDLQLLQSWIDSNLVFKTTELTIKNNVNVYKIKSEAQFCEIRIDANALTIRIHTYWS